jgi:sterol desaturase/sphingolipid hydroxylase (fatty acid hydroxylase superfamily)
MDAIVIELRPMFWAVFTTAKLLAITAAIFVPLERLFSLHPQSVFRKEIAVDIGYNFLNALVLAFVLAAPLSIILHVVRHFVPMSLIFAIAAWPIWLKACATMLVGEIAYYWAHRASHAIPFLWRFHAVHHSAEQLDFLVNIRSTSYGRGWSC